MRIKLDKQYDLALDDAIRMADGFFLKEQFTQAKQIYTQIAYHYPQRPHVLHSLGLIASKEQDRPEAERLLTEAVELDPQYAVAHHNLAVVCDLAAKHVKALHHACLALRIDAQNDDYWHVFQAVLRKLRGNPETICDPALVAQIVLLGLEESAIDTASIFGVLLHLLVCNKNLAALIHESSGQAHAADILTEQNLRAMEDGLHLALLEVSMLCDYRLETLLTRLRKAFALADPEQQQSLVVDHPRLFCALAQQCFLTEYIYNYSEEEGRRLDLHAARVAHHIEEGSAIPASLLILLACYKPLFQVHQLQGHMDLIDCADNRHLARLVRTQMEQPLVEERLRRKIPALERIRDAVSVAVAAQYEEHPYPRWTHKGRQKSIPFTAHIQNTHPHVSLELDAFPERPNILVAGCGTGQSLIFAALGYKRHDMLGVDLSLSSLAFAQRKLEELGIENVRLMQADILQLGELGQRFDVIECTGVLHHLSDPTDGWKTLCGLLRPGGFMNIVLYSKIARRNISRVQAGLAKRGCGTSAEQIRNCRHALMRDVPELGQMLTSFHDFYCVSGFRDMLLHEQEHQFTIPQIKKVIADLNLEFLGFMGDGEEWAKPYRTSHPDDPEMRSLDNWGEVEMANPDTFISMYRFWVRKPL